MQARALQGREAEGAVRVELDRATAELLSLTRDVEEKAELLKELRAALKLPEAAGHAELVRFDSTRIVHRLAR
jgi:hypothetical protein